METITSGTRIMTIEVPDETVIQPETNFVQDFYERAMAQDQILYTEILDGELKSLDSVQAIKLKATYDKSNSQLSVVQL